MAPTELAHVNVCVQVVLASFLGAAACFAPVARLPLPRPAAAVARRAGGIAALRAQADNILVLDHFNLNHEKGRHDVLKAFYADTLGCAIDPRKVRAAPPQPARGTARPPKAGATQALLL